MEIGKVEYRVRPVTRYVVTRHYETPEGRTGGTDVKGEFDNGDVAYEVAYALCKDEHDRSGLPPEHPRFQYPVKVGIQNGGSAKAKQSYATLGTV